ncbi:hypothetical protein LL251_15150, partial [Sphingobium naphthae]|nr:hypothetical protein [Sphingobium naphthae]
GTSSTWVNSQRKFTPYPGHFSVEINSLVDAGNTVVVVEHDMRAITQVDWIIDLGPGAGENGGRIVASGVPGVVAEAEGSLTARYLKAAL